MLKVSKLIQKNKKFIQNNFNLKILWVLIPLIIISLLIILISLFYDDASARFLTINEIKNLLPFEKENQFWTPLGYVIAGYGLPIVGGTMQIMTRNKLAGPTTLGYYPLILTAIMVSTLIMGGPLWIKYILAFSFSISVLLINFIITKSNVITNNFKVVLIGFVISAIFTGVNWLLHEYAQINISPLQWLSGGSDSVPDEKKLIISGVIVLVCTTILLLITPILNIISKDFLLAKSLGININLIYWIVALLGILITVSSVLLAGGVVLLGIIIPHISRMILRTSDNRIILPISGILGMLLLVISNWITRSLMPNMNINLLTAFVAIPVFILILRKK